MVRRLSRSARQRGSALPPLSPSSWEEGAGVGMVRTAEGAARRAYSAAWSSSAMASFQCAAERFFIMVRNSAVVLGKYSPVPQSTMTP